VNSTQRERSRAITFGVFPDPATRNPGWGYGCAMPPRPERCVMAR
jgi:hypothetical protein